MKVLVVEDDAENMSAIVKLLRVSWKIPSIELEIVGVGTLADAKREAPTANVTILDLELPDSTALETLGEIRSFPPPVIVLTGSGDEKLTATCLANGADHVFYKGAAIGLIPAVFESMQKDILRRAEQRGEREALAA